MISFTYILYPSLAFTSSINHPIYTPLPTQMPWAANAAATMLVIPPPPAAPCGLQMCWTWRTAKLNRYDPRCGAMA